MRHPLVPVAVLMAALILVGELGFGIFGRWTHPARNAAHYSHLLRHGEDDGTSTNNGREDCSMLVVVERIDGESAKTRKCEVEVKELTYAIGESHVCKGKMLLYIALPCDVAKGDTLLVVASPTLPDSASNPYQFDYRRHLLRHGITHTAYVPSYQWRHIGHDDRATLVERLRHKVLSVIDNSLLSPSQQGIAKAIFLGYDNDLTDETESHFRAAGITHLLCVSGLHVGIMALLVGYCLILLSNKPVQRIIKGLIQLAAIWFFVVLTGMAPGTTRAGLMFTLIVVGQTFFSRPTTLNAIAASAVIILAIKPLLLFDVGFQLSYSAVLGIVLMERRLEEIITLPHIRNARASTHPTKDKGESRLQKAALWLPHKLRTLFCVSLSAQIATLPFLLYYFHQFPAYFLVANMVIVPFAGLMLGSLLLMVLLSWEPWMFGAMGSVVACELRVTERVTSAIASWPHAMIGGIYFDEVMLVVSIALVAALAWLLASKKAMTVAASLAALVVLVAHIRIVDSRCSSQLHCDIYDIPRHAAAEFFVGNESYLVCDSAIAANPSSIDFQTANNLLRHQARRTHVIRVDSLYRDDYLMLEPPIIAFDGQLYRVDQPKWRQYRIAPIDKE